MRAEKTQLVQDLGDLMGSSAHVFMMSYQGLTVAQFSELRGKLAAAGAECHVIPNRLARKAAETVGLDALAKFSFKGDNAMVTGGADAVGVAKVLKTFAKDHDVVEIRGGALSGKSLDGTAVEALADLPPAEILYAQLLGVLQAPSRNLVGVLNAKVASIVYVVQAYLDSKE
jgi:large subunit ribosomal protein L10